jgi:intracellular multiplication protein IcmV
MAIKDIFKVNRKTFLNPTGWFGYGQVKSNTVTIIAIVKSLFFPKESGRVETFNEAQERFDMSDEEVQQTGQTYLYYSIFFALLSLIVIGYSFYLVIDFRSFSGFLLGVACAALFGSQAFRYNFWYFQIKHRKLGCTVQEWWKKSINGD